MPQSLRPRLTLVALLALLAVIASALVAAGPARAATTDLIISEYVEGSGSNKAVEVFNGTGAPVNLADYLLELYSNGSATVSNTFSPTGVLAEGDVYVIANPSASPALLALADTTNGGAVNFNGDDALVLRKGGATGTVVDSLGQVGVDPGTQWGSGTATTLDHTLRRNSSVLAGDTDPSNAFDPADQWAGFPTDTFDGLGTHTVDGGTPTDTAPSVSSTTPTSAGTDVALDNNVTVTFSEDVAAADGWFDISCSQPGGAPVAHPATATGGPRTFTLDPTIDFAYGDTCTVTVSAAAITDADAIDPPDTMTGDYTFSFATFTSNPCEMAFTHAYEVQGTGASSPFANPSQTVTTQGVVVADFQGSDRLSGFAIQDLTGDGNAATSDGLFVFGSAAPDVAVGDVVRVTGVVSEFRNQTELTYSSGRTFARCGQVSPPAPTVVHLPESVNGELERYEGMLVRVAERLTVEQNFFLGRFGQLTLGAGGRLYQPTNLFAAGSPRAQALAEANARSLLVLDDGTSFQNPSPTPYLDASNTRRAGNTVSGITGLLDEGPVNTSTTTNFDYRIQPTAPPRFRAGNARTARPERVGGNLKVASFNVLNYFTTTPAQNPDARGANDALEFDRQRTKIFAAMKAIDADVFGLMEIENLPGTAAVANLVDGLNAYRHSPGLYAAVPDPTTGTGTDAIKVAMIFKPSRVRPVGPSLSDPAPINNRAPLAQTFALNHKASKHKSSKHKASKHKVEKISVVVNHLKSKGSCPSAGDANAAGNLDSGDGQGCWNAQRVAQAAQLMTFIGQVQQAAKDKDVLAIGDFNSYGHEDPILALREAGLKNEIEKFIGPKAYSYVFDGLSGYLDHGLATRSASRQVVGASEWHINADEPSVIDYNLEFKPVDYYTPTAYRSSDHDPVVIGLRLGKTTKHHHHHGGRP